MAPHKARGLRKRDCAARRIQAFRDICSFRSGFHFWLRKLAAWHVRLIGTQADMSLAWIPSYLFSWEAQLSPAQGPPPTPSSKLD